MKRLVVNSNILGMAENDPVSISPRNWIYGYILYSLYLANSAKFKFSTNGRAQSGNKSGYVIELVTNTKGVNDPVTFQITTKSNNLVHLKGGIPGTNYIDNNMDPNTVIRTLLAF